MKKKTIQILNYTLVGLALVLVVGGISYISKGFTDWNIKDDLKSSSIVSSTNDSENNSSDSLLNSEITSNYFNSTNSENSSIDNKLKELSIVDGSKNDSLKISYTDETNNFSYEIKGISSLGSVSSSYQKCEVLNKSYLKAINTGGSSSSSKFIKLAVPQDLKIKVRVVGSSSNEQKIFMTGNIESTYNTTNYLELLVNNNTWVVSNYSEELSTGTYYINFTGNVKIAQIDINFIY